MTFLHRLGLSLAGGVAVFSIIRPAFAEVAKGDVGLQDDIVAGSDVPVNARVVGNHTEVYYLLNGHRELISSDKKNASLPDSDGQLITYRENSGSVDQIYLFDAITKTTVQLSTQGHNTNPTVDKGRVVWESWTGNSWQLFFFDGLTVKQITQGDIAIHPVFFHDDLVFARRSASNKQWRAERYNIATGETTVIGEGMDTKYPRIVNDEIVFGLPDSIQSTPSATPTSTTSPTPEDNKVAEITPTPSFSATPETSPSLTPTPAQTKDVPIETPTITTEDVLKELLPSPTPEITPTPTPSLEPTPTPSPTPTETPL